MKNNKENNNGNRREQKCGGKERRVEERWKREEGIGKNKRREN